MTDWRYDVSLLCTGNSARSIMAKAIINRLGLGRFKGYSAGSHPKAEVHPHVRDLLQKLNFPTTALRPKDWNEFAQPGAPKLDFVFTLCDDAAKEACPNWPGQPMTAHWGLPDPASAQGNDAERRLAFADAFRMLNNRISIFIALPMKSLDKLSFQHRLDEIGRTTKAPEAARASSP